MSLITTSGIVKRPKIIVLFGVESVGKTEFATKFPSPFFIDFEGASRRYPVERILPSDKDYFAVKEWLMNHDNVKNHKTLIIDSLDWVERAMSKALCEKAKVTNVQDLGGYGKWVEVLNAEWISFVNTLRDLIEKTQIDLVMTSHYEVKRFDDPITMAPYDRYIMKLMPKHGALIREWVEAVLFANFQTFSKVKSVTDSKGKGIGSGLRVLYTEKRPAHDAKNRYSLPYEMPMDYETLMAYINASPEDEIKNLQSDIEALFLDVKDAELLEKSKAFYELSKNDLDKLRAIKQRLMIIVGE